MRQLKKKGLPFSVRVKSPSFCNMFLEGREMRNDLSFVFGFLKKNEKMKVKGTPVGGRASMV